MPTNWRNRAAAVFFPSRSPGWIVDVSGLVLVLVGCGIDLSADPLYSPLPFFLLPVIYVAWFSPRYITGVLCIGLMAISNFVVAYSDNSSISYVEDYNALTRIATLALVYWIVRQLQGSMYELREAKSRLEYLNREKDLLFGVISHDLRGALGVMLASSRLMTRPANRPSDEQLRMIADGNRTAAEKALALLEDLLEWSRLQIGGSTLRAQAVPIAPLVDACVEAAADQAEQRKVLLKAGEISDRLSAAADERAIRVVLRNLIGNALKFTGEGGEVRVSACAAGERLMLFVKDTGIGVPEEKLRRLLAGDSAGSERGLRGESGAGFGLSMCKDILERFGGRLNATSAVGIGSEFSISLPCAPQTKTADSERQDFAAGS